MSTQIDARNVNVVVFREFAHDDWPKVVTRGLKVVVEESLSVVIPPSLWRFYAGVSLAVLRSVRIIDLGRNLAFSVTGLCFNWIPSNPAPQHSEESWVCHTLDHRKTTPRSPHSVRPMRPDRPPSKILHGTLKLEGSTRVVCSNHNPIHACQMPPSFGPFDLRNTPAQSHHNVGNSYAHRILGRKIRSPEHEAGPGHCSSTLHQPRHCAPPVGQLEGNPQSVETTRLIIA